MYIFNIKNIRISQNISIKKLSSQTGISRTYIRGLENQEKTNPTLDILNKIAKALNVNIKDLFYSYIELDKLKNELYKRIDKYGVDSKEVLEISQIIDLLVNIEMNNKKTSHND